jgi:hypothetical protein
MGTILRASSADKPKVKARFGDESASIAIVFSPLSAKPRAKPAAIRVLPTPPLPETAIFMVFPSGKVLSFHGLFMFP